MGCCCERKLDGIRLGHSARPHAQIVALCIISPYD
jgi:hypothetical protein